jgi:hypothetical protein
MRYIHISKKLVTVMAPNGTLQTIAPRRGGNTLNVGRNAEKRAARRREMLIRQTNVADRDALMVAYFGREPKGNKSRLTVDMLADRRLRQRGGDSDPRQIHHRHAA